MSQRRGGKSTATTILPNTEMHVKEDVQDLREKG